MSKTKRAKKNKFEKIKNKRCERKKTLKKETFAKKKLAKTQKNLAKNEKTGKNMRKTSNTQKKLIVPCTYHVAQKKKHNTLKKTQHLANIKHNPLQKKAKKNNHVRKKKQTP